MVIQNNKGGTICTTYYGGTIKHGGTDNNTIMNKDKHIPSGYKPSPLGIIPEDWEVKRLGEVCTHFKSGITITSKDIHEEGLYPVYGGNGLRGYTNTFTHDGNYILIGRQGALCGNINYVDGKNYISEHAIAVQTDENMQWLKYKLENWNLNRFSESSAQPGLSVEKLVRYKLVIPTRLEQNKIADILSLWDTAIAKQTALIENLTLRKRGLMQQLLTGKKRLKGFSGEWERIKAGEIFKSISVKGNGSEVLLSATQEHGVIPRDQLESRVTMPTGDTNSFKLVEVGDFIISLRSFQGGLEYSEHRGIVSPAYTVLKPIVEIDKSFYRYYFKSAEFIGHLAIAVIGIRDGKQISYEDFCFVKIPYPNIKEQKAISSVLLQADKEIEIQKQKLAAMQEQKKGLMQVLLTGKKRIVNHKK